jgi:hypothetical protein
MIIRNDFEPPAYTAVSVGVKVAVIVEDPAPTSATRAPPSTALTVVVDAFELL